MSVSRRTRAACDRHSRQSGDLPRAALLLALLALLVFSAACHKKQARVRPPRVPQQRTAAPPVSVAPLPGETETGYASWYGNPYHGRRTSSGEIYDMYQMTAAHRTLPLGTEVEVTNLETGEKVRVRINDRGPFVEGRIIDLSLTAARAIHVWGPGTAMVQVKVLSVPNTTLYAATRPPPRTPPVAPAASAPVVVAASAPPDSLPPAAPPSVEEQASTELAAMRTNTSNAPAGGATMPVPAATGDTFPAAAGRFTAQVGAFSDRRNAERLRGSLAARYPQYVVQTIPTPDGKYFRVWVGNEPTEDRASAIARQLGQDGTTAFVIRVD